MMMMMMMIIITIIVINSHGLGPWPISTSKNPEAQQYTEGQDLPTV